MKKVINPCTCEVCKGKTVNAFVEISYENGKLSMSGVIGPRKNGDCFGSCGQCIEEIGKGTPKDEWTQEMLDKLCDIWNRFHLNDMRPYCQHQKELGWDKLSRKEVILYHYRLTREAIGKQKEAENAALDALRKGKAFTPTEEQQRFAVMKYSITTNEEISGEKAMFYEPRKSTYPGDQGFTEKKTLGWLRCDEHPDGLLSKPCPVCGYKYGHEWKTEEVPDDVVEWLSNLPETKTIPAWV